MSQGISCKCPESKKRVENRQWMVTQRNQRCSAFDGYQPMHSDYSVVRCKVCHSTWRTKADFVNYLPNAPADWAMRP